MSQTRLGSLVEVLVYAAIGYFAAMVTQIVVFPWFDIHVPVSTNASLGLIFMVQSIVLRYVLRRAFNNLGLFRKH